MCVAPHTPPLFSLFERTTHLCTHLPVLRGMTTNSTSRLIIDLTLYLPSFTFVFVGRVPSFSLSTSSSSYLISYSFSILFLSVLLLAVFSLCVCVGLFRVGWWVGGCKKKKRGRMLLWSLAAWQVGGSWLLHGRRTTGCTRSTFVPSLSTFYAQ